MKFYLKSPSVCGTIDPPLLSIWKDFPGRVHSMEEADVVVVIISNFQGFVFDVEGMGRINKPWILADGIEHGWDWDQEDTIRIDTDLIRHRDRGFRGNWDEWVKFNFFCVMEKPPVMQFKRELLKKDVGPRLQPMEYLCRFPIEEPASKASYDARPFNLMYTWGRSAEYRALLHGEMFRYSPDEVLSEFDHTTWWLNNRSSSEKANVIVHTPWYARTPMDRLLQVQGMSKVSVSMAGSGQCCFRHSESCTNSVMALQENKKAWSFPWDESNSLSVPTPDECDFGHAALTLFNRMENSDLYELYCAGLENAKCYLPLRYWSGHIKPSLESCL